MGDRMVRVFLDVDGVLNACGECRWEDKESGRGMGFNITWSPTVVKFVHELNDRPDVEVCWLTTWEHNANEHLPALMGVPEMEVIERRPYEAWGEKWWWKLRAVQAYWETYEQAPFVWLDDDLAFDEESIEWLEGLPVGKFLAIAPPTERGLETEHLDLVRSFIDGHGSPAG